MNNNELKIAIPAYFELKEYISTQKTELNNLEREKLKISKTNQDVSTDNYREQMDSVNRKITQLSGLINQNESKLKRVEDDSLEYLKQYHPDDQRKSDHIINADNGKSYLIVITKNPPQHRMNPIPNWEIYISES